ncbi:hypothetical protein V6N13_091285 [Hibiscus sabdariffa]
MSSSPMDHFLGWRTTLCVPHAHFDPSAQDQRYGSVTPLVNTYSIYHSLHPEDTMEISSVVKVVVTGSNGIAEQQIGIRHIS